MFTALYDLLFDPFLQASLADAAIYVVIEFCEAVLPDFKSSTVPALAEIAKQFSQIPAIAEWIKSRPESSL